MDCATSRKITQFIKVDTKNVVQMELHVLAKDNENRNWLQRKHCQEVEVLLFDVIRNRVKDELGRRAKRKKTRKRLLYQKKKQIPLDSYTRPQILTGELLKMAYSFKKQTLPHSHLLLYSKGSGYKSFYIFNEKLVVYVYHLEGYNSFQHTQKQDQSISTAMKPQMSSYFNSDDKQTVVPEEHNILKKIIHNKTEKKQRLKKKIKARQREMSEIDTDQHDKNDDGLIQKHDYQRSCGDSDITRPQMKQDQLTTADCFGSNVTNKPVNQSLEDGNFDQIESSGLSQAPNSDRTCFERMEFSHCTLDDRQSDVVKGRENECDVVAEISSLSSSCKNNLVEVTVDSAMNHNEKVDFCKTAESVTEIHESSTKVSIREQKVSSLEGSDVVQKVFPSRISKRKTNKHQQRKQGKKLKLIHKFLDMLSDIPTSDEDVKSEHSASDDIADARETSSCYTRHQAMQLPMTSTESKQGEEETSDSIELPKYKTRLGRLRLKKKKPLSSDVEGDIHPEKTLSDKIEDMSGKSVVSLEAQNSVKSLEESSSESTFAAVTHSRVTNSPSSRKTRTSDMSVITKDNSPPPLLSLSHYLRRTLAEPTVHQIKAGQQADEDDVVIDLTGVQLDDSVVEDLSQSVISAREIEQIRQISNLSEDHLVYLIKVNEKYLKDIFEAKIRSRRHEDYQGDRKQRVGLSWQIPLGLFTDAQVDIILGILQKMFCAKSTKYLDYVLKVLFPEVLIKIYMDVFHVDHHTAEEDMANAVYQSDSQSATNLTDSN